MTINILKNTRRKAQYLRSICEVCKIEFVRPDYKIKRLKNLICLDCNKKSKCGISKVVNAEKRLEEFLSGKLVECKKHGFHTNYSVYLSKDKKKLIKCSLCSNETRNNRHKDLYFHLNQIIKNTKRHRPDNNELTLQLVNQFLEMQNNKCALTGILFSDPSKISIDRINSNFGYLKNNIQLVHIDLNRMKSNFQQDYFIESCEKIFKNKIYKDQYFIGVG